MRFIMYLKFRRCTQTDRQVVDKNHCRAVVKHTLIPALGTGGSLSLRSAWSTKWVPGQPGLYRRNPVSKNNNNNKNKKQKTKKPKNPRIITTGLLSDLWWIMQWSSKQSSSSSRWQNGHTHLAVVSPSSCSGPYLSMYFSQVLMCALMSLRQTYTKQIQDKTPVGKDLYVTQLHNFQIRLHWES